MNPKSKEQILEYLSGFLTDNRKEKFQTIIENRTKYITVIAEDLYQSHNTSAVMRSCDCFGIQEMHVIEQKNSSKVNQEIALGASNWINIYRENNTETCINTLKKKGYRIVATTPHKNDQLLDDLPLEKGKIALLFGTEKDGLSEEAMSLADEFVKIPMFGFTESFNISVSAAICMYSLVTRLHNSGIDWKLTDQEKLDTLLDWTRNTIRNVEMIEKDFLEKNG